MKQFQCWQFPCQVCQLITWCRFLIVWSWTKLVGWSTGKRYLRNCKGKKLSLFKLVLTFMAELSFIQVPVHSVWSRLFSHWTSILFSHCIEDLSRVTASWCRFPSPAHWITIKVIPCISSCISWLCVWAVVCYSPSALKSCLFSHWRPFTWDCIQTLQTF